MKDGKYHETELYRLMKRLCQAHDKAFDAWIEEIAGRMSPEQSDEIATALKAEMRGPGYAKLLAVVEDLEESSEYWSEYFVPLGIVDRMRAALAEAKG